MKKNLHRFERVFNSDKLHYLLLTIPLFLQSCFISENLTTWSDPGVQVSADMVKQTYSGVSYDTKSQTGEGIGYNIGAIILTSPGGTLGTSSGGSQSFNDKEFGNPENFYASLSNDPSVLYSSSQNARLETSGKEAEPSTSGFMSHLFYSGGIEFIQKKSKDHETTIALNYLEIPLYALYQINSTDQGYLFGGLGPYFAYGVGGKSKSSYGGNAQENKSFDKDTGYKPFDAGVGFTAGYKLTDGFSFSLAYELGLTNLERNDFGDKAKNRCLSLNVRYPLDKLIK